MKNKISNKIKTLFILGIMIVSTSCDESFIDLAPISSPNVEAFYKTQSDFETASIAVYAEWQNLFSTQWTEFNEFRGDTYTHVQYSYREISENQFLLNTTSPMWNRLYSIIAKANILLDKIDAVEKFDEATKNRIKAEARFFRAEAYFALVRFFGGVPLVTHETTSNEALTIVRASVADIFKVIEEDYRFAVDNLPPTVSDANYGRITKYGAEGELARVYITLSGKVYNTNRWTDAKPLLEDILNNSTYKFSASYKEIFASDRSNEKGKEIILSALFKAGGQGEGTEYQRQFVGPYWGYLTLFEDGVIESYETGDLRKDVNILMSYVDIDGIQRNDPTNGKFNYGYDPSSRTSGMDFPILRYTDIYLLYAETLSEIANGVPSQSLDILNNVRNRAGLTSLTATNVPNIAAFRLAMEKERRSELMFECVRWFDIVRTGRAVDLLKAIGKNANDTWLLFPIPQTEIDKVGKDILPQNPGYQ
jgi:hypothetical protein